MPKMSVEPQAATANRKKTYDNCFQLTSNTDNDLLLEMSLRCSLSNTPQSGSMQIWSMILLTLTKF